MKFYIKIDTNTACQTIVREQFEARGIDFELVNSSEVTIKRQIAEEQLAQLEQELSNYGIELISNPKNQLIQKIKDTIVALVHEPEMPLTTISVYLSDKLNLSYGYISNLFSEYTFSSIENYFIIQKIERAKKLIIEEDLTLTEISYKLNYSSVAHLSGQFKKTTGLTPSMFKRIIEKRRESAEVN